MRKRLYGKPLPPKSQVRAHLQLFEMVKDEGMKMNIRTIKLGVTRLGTDRKVLILENGQCIPFQGLDFGVSGDNSDYVDLLEHGSVFAVIDLRSVTGIKLENA